MPKVYHSKLLTFTSTFTATYRRTSRERKGEAGERWQHGSVSSAQGGTGAGVGEVDHSVGMAEDEPHVANLQRQRNCTGVGVCPFCSLTQYTAQHDLELPIICMPWQFDTSYMHIYCTLLKLLREAREEHRSVCRLLMHSPMDQQPDHGIVNHRPSHQNYPYW